MRKSVLIGFFVCILALFLVSPCIAYTAPDGEEYTAYWSYTPSFDLSKSISGAYCDYEYIDLLNATNYYIEMDFFYSANSLEGGPDIRWSYDNTVDLVSPTPNTVYLFDWWDNKYITVYQVAQVQIYYNSGSGTATYSATPGVQYNTSNPTKLQWYNNGAWVKEQTYSSADIWITSAYNEGQGPIDGIATISEVRIWADNVDPTPIPTGTPTPTPTISGETTIRWDQTSYTQGTTAIITYYIRDSDWDSGSYDYCGQVLDLDGVSVLKEWIILTQPAGDTVSQYIDQGMFSESGTYYCVLYAESKATGSKTLLASDVAAINLFEHVSVSGTTYDAINMTPLGAVNVSISQAGDSSYTTSSTWGFYGKDDLYDSFWVGINGTKDGWVCSPSGFSPSGTHEYVVDLSLIPAGGAEPGDWANTGNDSYSTNTTYSSTNTSYWSAEEQGSAIGGYVYGGAMVAALSGATVTMSNATWDASTESGSDGWYMFSETGDGIYPGSYTISAEQTGYESSLTSVVVVEDYFGRKDFYLARGEYTYTDDSSSAENTSYWTTAEGTACGGIVYLGELWDVGGGDSITISNASWSNTTTTSTGGWWKFNESDGLSDNFVYLFGCGAIIGFLFWRR